MTATDEPIEKLAQLIREHQPCVALTGAGVSTESGVPDFRSPTGMWAEFDPMEYATLGAFRRDPVKVWRFYAPRFAMLTEAEPNAAHRALAELERLGLVRAVVTQNIDLLHERAGSRDVVEVHGSIRTSSCLSCGAVYPLAEVAPLVEAGDGAPACRACGAILKPDVVFFDELLPEGALERAQALAEEARLLLVVGSSLEVHPVADLPHATLAAGGKVAVVNRTATWVDGRAALVLRGSAGEVLAGALAALRSGSLEVTDYDPDWPGLYEEEAALIRAALGQSVVAMEHMGSTAVPGLAGKAVIDISVGLRRPELTDAQVSAMERLGYEYLGEFSSRPALLPQGRGRPAGPSGPRGRARRGELAPPPGLSGLPARAPGGGGGLRSREAAHCGRVDRARGLLGAQAAVRRRPVRQRLGVVLRAPLTLRPAAGSADGGSMRTDTPDFLGVLLWTLQAIFFTTWALWSLARHGGQPDAAVLAVVAFGAALLGYRRARSLRSG